MRKFKTILAVSTVTLTMLSPVAFAGFYTGVGFGVRPLSADFSKMIATGVHVNNLNLSVVKPAVDLFVGYQWMLHHGIFVATELYYEYVDMNATVGFDINNVLSSGLKLHERVSAELDYNVNISALLGYQSTNKDIFYTRLGLLFDDLKYKAESQVSGISDDSYEGTHYAGAFQLGLGVVHPFNKHWSVRGEYTYSRYPDVDVKISAYIPVVGEQTVVSFTPQVSINAVTVSLLYSFS